MILELFLLFFQTLLLLVAQQDNHFVGLFNQACFFFLLYFVYFLTFEVDDFNTIYFLFHLRFRFDYYNKKETKNELYTEVMS